MSSTSTQSQVTCPKCGDAISITQAIGAEIEARFEREARAKIQSARLEIEKKLREEIAARNQVEFADLKAQVEEKNKRLLDAQTKELEFRKKQRELEEREKNVELLLQRKLDEEKRALLRKHEDERARMTAEAVTRAVEEYRQKAAEKDHQLDGMRKQIEDLKRKSEQGSQQIQGEVLELELETLLRQTFPGDQIEPVAKGQRGGDIVHKILSTSGQVSGTILWETKRTKTWTDGWITKLKEDQREITAECAVIVSTVLPKTVTRMGQLDGVWVCELGLAVGIATVLRTQLLQVHLAKAVALGQSGNADRIYQYVTGTQFKQHVEAILEIYRRQHAALHKEKTASAKNFAVREKELALMSCEMVSMVGDIQGLVGSSMPKIAALEFDEESTETGTQGVGLTQGDKEIPAYAQTTLQGFTQS